MCGPARSDLISEKTAAGFYGARIAYGYSGASLLRGQVVRARAVRVKEVEATLEVSRTW